jgi:N-acetyl-gamma-glutamyl-phosphate reductase
MVKYEIMVKTGIIGGAGYTGGELLRILLRHPAVDIAFVLSRSQAGKALAEVHQDLAGETDLVFTDGMPEETDLLFLCLGHGESRKFLDSNRVPEKIRLIDLSQDYRLHQGGKRPGINGHEFIYGLPELNRERIREARHVANPGCFATAIQLGLLPLAKAGRLGEVYATGITGSTGAGQGLSETSHFSWRANNIQAYKSLRHQHIQEVGQTLEQLQSGFRQAGGSVHFVPWRGDFTRGIFVSSQLKWDGKEEELFQLYEDYYRGHPFSIVSRSPVFLKQVVNTNKCMIQLDLQGEMLVVHTALDNLLKGASGQAVQNMNLLFGLEETAGLHLKANYY